MVGELEVSVVGMAQLMDEHELSAVVARLGGGRDVDGVLGVGGAGTLYLEIDAVRSRRRNHVSAPAFRQSIDKDGVDMKTRYCVLGG